MDRGGMTDAERDLDSPGQATAARGTAAGPGAPAGPAKPNEEAEVVMPTGPAAAALLGAAIGIFALAMAHLLGRAFEPFEETLFDFGRFFVPGGDQLGSFGGKELTGLLVWLTSWAVLHLRWRNRSVRLITTVYVFLALLVLATLLIWPPIQRPLIRWLLALA